MKKKILIILGIAIMLFAVVLITIYKDTASVRTAKEPKNEITNSINNKNQEEVITDTKTETQWKSENVKITLKEDSITKTSAIIKIIDKNETPKSWRIDFAIQKSGDNDKWIDMITKEKVTWLAIAMQPNENGITEMQLDWAKIYGELNTGTYRIVKNNGLSTLYSEPFTIK